MPRVNIVFVSAPINATYPISLDSALDHSALNCPLKSVFPGRHHLEWALKLPERVLEWLTRWNADWLPRLLVYQFQISCKA